MHIAALHIVPKQSSNTTENMRNDIPAAALYQSDNIKMNDNDKDNYQAVTTVCATIWNTKKAHMNKSNANK